MKYVFILILAFIMLSLLSNVRQLETVINYHEVAIDQLMDHMLELQEQLDNNNVVVPSIPIHHLPIEV